MHCHIQLSGDEANPDEALATFETWRLMVDGIGALTPKQREVFLAYLADDDLRSVAAETGLSLSAAHARLNSAFKGMRLHFESARTQFEMWADRRDAECAAIREARETRKPPVIVSERPCYSLLVVADANTYATIVEDARRLFSFCRSDTRALKDAVVSVCGHETYQAVSRASILSLERIDAPERCVALFDVTNGDRVRLPL